LFSIQTLALKDRKPPTDNGKYVLANDIDGNGIG
jgi:hypothetical protein